MSAMSAFRLQHFKLQVRPLPQGCRLTASLLSRFAFFLLTIGNIIVSFRCKFFERVIDFLLTPKRHSPVILELFSVRFLGCFSFTFHNSDRLQTYLIMCGGLIPSSYLRQMTMCFSVSFQRPTCRQGYKRTLASI
jgi:hypothetical protein